MLTKEDKKRIQKESEREVVAIFIIIAIVLISAVFLVTLLTIRVLQFWGVI